MVGMIFVLLCKEWKVRELLNTPILYDWYGNWISWLDSCALGRWIFLSTLLSEFWFLSECVVFGSASVRYILVYLDFRTLLQI